MKEKLAGCIETLSRLLAETEARIIKGGASEELTDHQIYAIETIKKMNNPSPSELAKKMDITKSTVSALIDRLEKGEYVIRVKSDEDKRSLHLHLSEKGEKISSLHDQAHSDVAEKFIQNLEENELETFHTLLKKVLRGCAD